MFNSVWGWREFYYMYTYIWLVSRLCPVQKLMLLTNYCINSIVVFAFRFRVYINIPITTHKPFHMDNCMKDLKIGVLHNLGYIQSNLFCLVWMLATYHIFRRFFIDMILSLSKWLRIHLRLVVTTIYVSIFNHLYITIYVSLFLYRKQYMYKCVLMYKCALIVEIQFNSMLCNAMLCYAMLCYAMQCYAMSVQETIYV